MSRNNETAYPHPHLSGMTIRERFAMAAMQAIISACGTGMGDVEYDDEVVARSAVETADALIAELAKEPKP